MNYSILGILATLDPTLPYAGNGTVLYMLHL